MKRFASALGVFAFVTPCAAVAQGDEVALEVESMTGSARFVEAQPRASGGKWVRLTEYNVTLEGRVRLPAGVITIAVHGHTDDAESDGFRIGIDDALVQRVSMGSSGVRSLTQFFPEAGEHRILLMSDIKDKGVCLDVVRLAVEERYRSRGATAAAGGA